MGKLYNANETVDGHELDCVRVELNNEISFVSRRYYQAWVLQMSTAEFHIHKVRIAYLDETYFVCDLDDEPVCGIQGVPTYFEACHFNFRMKPEIKHTCEIVNIRDFRRPKTTRKLNLEKASIIKISSYSNRL